MCLSWKNKELITLFTTASPWSPTWVTGKPLIRKMDFNISAAPLISYPSWDSRNFCNVCSLISVYSLTGYKRQQITIFSLQILLSQNQFTWFLWQWFEERHLQGESSSLCWLTKGKQLCKGMSSEHNYIVRYIYIYIYIYLNYIHRPLWPSSGWIRYQMKNCII